MRPAGSRVWPRSGARCNPARLCAGAKVAIDAGASGSLEGGLSRFQRRPLDRMFPTILIANRGEIACRVIKTARRMGIRTVAVFSDADRDALHVEMADEAVHLGPAQAAQSYLAIDKIVEACRRTGAQAVHPGYGFLSEREAFPQALAAAAVTVIGPTPT